MGTVSSLALTDMIIYIYHHNQNMRTARAPSTRDPTKTRPSFTCTPEAAMAALVGDDTVGLLVDVGGGDVADPVVGAAAATIMASFIPPAQCPAVPQMKYLLPALPNKMVVLPPFSVAVGLDVEHESYADLVTSSTSWSVVYLKMRLSPTLNDLPVAHVA